MIIESTILNFSKFNLMLYFNYELKENLNKFKIETKYDKNHIIKEFDKKFENIITFDKLNINSLATILLSKKDIFLKHSNFYSFNKEEIKKYLFKSNYPIKEQKKFKIITDKYFKFKIINKKIKKETISFDVLFKEINLKK